MDYLHLYKQNTFRLRQDLTSSEKFSFLDLLFRTGRKRIEQNDELNILQPPSPGLFYAYIPIGHGSMDDEDDPNLINRIFHELYGEREVLFFEETEDSDSYFEHVQVAFLSRAIQNPLHRPKKYFDDYDDDDYEISPFHDKVVFPAFQPDCSHDSRHHENTFEELFSPHRSFNPRVVFALTQQEAESFSPYIDPPLTQKPFFSANVTDIPQL